MYYHEVIREKKRYMVLPWSSRLSLSARQEFILCPTDRTFISLTLTMQIARAVNLLLTCAQARPARVDSFSAKTRARNSEFSFFFFFLRENKGSSNLVFTPACPLTYGTHLTWTNKSGTVYLLCEESGAKFTFYFFALRENKDSSNLGFMAARPLTCGAHLTWTHTSGTVKHMMMWWYIIWWPQNTICTNLRLSYTQHCSNDLKFGTRVHSHMPN